MYDRTYIPARIKERRRELGMTQTELAQKVTGLETASHIEISSWETGRVIPGTDSLIGLCNALDCDAGFLFGEYPEHSHKYADIRESTGLSETAVKGLEEPGVRMAVERLLSSPRGLACLRAINAYLTVPDVPGEISITDSGEVVAPSVWDIGLLEADGVDIQKYMDQEDALFANYRRIGSASRLAEQAFLLDIESDLKELRASQENDTYRYSARSVAREEEK